MRKLIGDTLCSKALAVSAGIRDAVRLTRTSPPPKAFLQTADPFNSKQFHRLTVAQITKGFPEVFVTSRHTTPTAKRITGIGEINR